MRKFLTGLGAALAVTIMCGGPSLAVTQKVPPTASRPSPPAGGAAEETGQPPELLALFPGQANQAICYSRRYDAKHLAAHPQQQVTEMDFRMVFRTVQGEADDMAEGHLFQMGVKLRGEKEKLSGLGPCMVNSTGKVFCGIECDGGGVYVKKRDDGALLVSFDDMWGIRLADDCGEDEENAKSLEPGKDDKSFRLDPLPAAQCPRYEDW